MYLHGLHRGIQSVLLLEPCKVDIRKIEKCHIFCTRTDTGRAAIGVPKGESSQSTGISSRTSGEEAVAGQSPSKTAAEAESTHAPQQDNINSGGELKTEPVAAEASPCVQTP